MLDSGISLLRCHATFKSANLAGVWISLPVLTIKQGKVKLTLNPARCSLKAIKSKKDTNCENTSDLIVQSLCLNFSSSSTSASSFEDDRQLYNKVRTGLAMEIGNLSIVLTPRSSLLKMPCLAFLVFSSKSKASASRSMEISIWQTGHSGLWPRICFTSRYCLIHSRSKTCLHCEMIASSAYKRIKH